MGFEPIVECRGCGAPLDVWQPSEARYCHEACKEDEMGKVTESIYSGKSVVVPLADVQHIERGNPLGLIVVTKHTRWDRESGGWANNIWVGKEEEPAFMRAWCRYRSELEADTG